MVVWGEYRHKGTNTYICISSLSSSLLFDNWCPSWHDLDSFEWLSILEGCSRLQAWFGMVFYGCLPFLIPTPLQNMLSAFLGYWHKTLLADQFFSHEGGALEYYKALGIPVLCLAWKIQHLEVVLQYFHQHIWIFTSAFRIEIYFYRSITL